MKSNVMDVRGMTHRSVLFVSDLDVWTMGQGSGCPTLSRLLQAYSQAGWKVVFLTGSGKQSSQVLPGIDIVRFGAPWLKRWFGVRRLGAVARFLWWLLFPIIAVPLGLRLNREAKFSVVYGYEIRGIPAAKFLSRLLRIPLVTFFQGTIIEPGLEGGRGKYLRAWDHWYALRMPADLIVMMDDGTQGDRVLREVGADMDKVRFWMNGSDKDAFVKMPTRRQARRSLGLEQRHVILMLSRLVWWKCIDRGISAMPRVIADNPDTLLMIVGDGADRPRLERLASDLGVADHVRFAGAVPHADIKTYLAVADIFLSLYTWSNVGNPLLEAMLAGKCIVTLATGDTARVVKHEQTGILLDEDNLAPLPGVLTSLLRDPERAKELGTNARVFAQKHFHSWDERTSMEIAEVTELLENSANGQKRKVVMR